MRFVVVAAAELAIPAIGRAAHRLAAHRRATASAVGAAARAGCFETRRIAQSRDRAVDIRRTPVAPGSPAVGARTVGSWARVARTSGVETDGAVGSRRGVDGLAIVPTREERDEGPDEKEEVAVHDGLRGRRRR
jgi:hypothetical protein